MTRTLRYLLLVLFVGIAGDVLAQAGEIFGTVLEASKQPAINAVISVDQGGIVKGGGVTDFDGNYSIKPLQAGTYNLKVQYAGHNTITVTGIIVSPGQATKQSFNLEASKGTQLKEVVVKYVRPLVDVAKPGVNFHLDAKDIKNLPTRNTADMASLSTGVYQGGRSGGELNIGGGRGTGTLYIIDGVQVNGAAGINQAAGAIEQMEVLSSGIPAKYGDASGGVITLTTRGVSKNYAGGLLLEHSVDGYNTNYASFNLSGPFASRKVNDIKKPIVGFFLAGDYRYDKDNAPSYYDNYVVKADKLAELRAHPLVPVSSPTGIPVFKYATDYVTKSDLETSKARANAQASRASITGKLDYEIVPGTNLTAGGQFFYSNTSNYNRSLSLFAPDATPSGQSYTGRGYLRFTQRFGKPTAAGAAGEKKDENKITNAYYTVQADYQRDYSSSEDPNHKRNPFLYNYVGKFTELQMPAYSTGPEQMLDTSTNINGIRLLGYFPVGVAYQRAEVNPNLANYTSQYYELGGANPLSLTNIPSNGAYLRNGDNPNRSYSMWSGVGTSLSGYSYARADQFSLGVDASFDYKVKKMKHAIGFGLYYQQRAERSYSIGPNQSSNLWSVMRQLTHAVVGTNMDYSNPIFVVNGQRYTKEQMKESGINPGPNDTILYNRAFNDSAYTVGGFDYNLRNKLGLDAKNRDYLQPDAYDPSIYSLNMFTADELINSGKNLVNYYGYDYLGNAVNGQVNFNDFWTKKDANGNYTRPIGAYRPNYVAGYISDNIRFKDLNFNIGVRVERFDNNTKVLIDPYSLYAEKSAGQVASYNTLNGGTNPANIGSDYTPYINDNTSKNPTIVGYRSGDTWYDPYGREVTDPQSLKAYSGGRDPQPFLQNVNGAKITESGYDPNSAFTDYKPQVNVMPRISFSFPINEDALFYAHYDVIMQRPKPGLSSILSGAGAYATPMDYMFLQQNSSETIGNPNLKPEKLVDYEVGFQQKLTDLSAITINAFYKERRDQIQMRPYLYAYPTTYYTYGNRDFSTTKGLGLKYEMRRINHLQMSLNYTLQFAEGTGSSATSNGGGLQTYLISANLPNLRITYPLSYDSRNIIAGSFDYRYDENEGPEVAGKKILQNAGINLMVQARSGEPYTKYAEPRSAQVGVPGSNLIQGGINGSRLPWHYMLNLKVDKSFALNFNGKKTAEGAIVKRKPYSLNAYVMIQNLLNTQDILGVYGYTGSAKDDGYLTSPTGMTVTAGQTSAQAFTDQYSIWMQNPGYYNLPRRIMLGVQFNF